MFIFIFSSLLLHNNYLALVQLVGILNSLKTSSSSDC